MPVPTFDDKTVWKQHLIYLLVATLLVETALAFCIITIVSLNMSRRGIRCGKVKEPEQFAISQPTVIDLFDKLSTRSGRHYPRSPHVIKPLRTTRQRPASVGAPKDVHLASPLSSPVRITSTEALGTEEGEEVTKYLTESVIKRQRRASVSIMQDTKEYENDLPQPSIVPIPLPRE